MGIESVGFNFADDYAAKGKQALDAQTFNLKLRGVNVKNNQTIPIGKSQDNNQDKPIAGTQIESEEKLYDTRKKRNAAEKQLQEQGINGVKLSKDEAKLQVKEAHYKEEYETYNENNVVYANKKQYQAAKKEYEKAEKEAVKNREKGVSKKEARKKFEAEHKNIVLAGRIARKTAQKLGVIENDGTLGKKSEELLENIANIDRVKGLDAESHDIALKQRRAAKEYINVKQSKLGLEKVTVNGLGQLADAKHMHKERNNTALYRGAVVGAVVATAGIASYAAGGIGVGAAASAADAAGAAGCGAAAGAAAAGAGAAAAHIGWATITTGAGVLAAGGSAFLRDGGKKVKFAREITPPVQPPKPPVQPPKPPVEPPKPPVQPCPEDKLPAYCEHTVQRGDDWSRVAQGKVTINGKKLEGKLLRAYVHAEKLQHGVNDFTKNTFMKENEIYKLYTNFDNLINNEEIVKKHPELLLLKDAKIAVDCDADYIKGKAVKHPNNPFVKYTGTAKDVQYVTDCNGKIVRVEVK